MPGVARTIFAVSEEEPRRRRTRAKKKKKKLSYGRAKLLDNLKWLLGTIVVGLPLLALVLYAIHLI